MGISETLTKGIVESQKNFVRGAWDRLHRLPGGKVAFSRIVGRAAPYTGTIRPLVEELRHRYARVSMQDRRAVRQHLESVHAIALANLCELTGNIALSYTMPDDARFIVAGISVEYKKKARGTITGTCDCPDIPSTAEREYQVPVVLKDASGDVVAECVLRTLVGPKR